MSKALTEQVWAVVPAAGAGRRYGADKPKQYLELAGQLIAQRTLDTLCNAKIFQGIVVAISNGDTHFATLPCAGNPLINCVDGGDSRAHSVLAGLRALANSARPDDWVMVHDIARPLISVDALHRLLAAVTNNAITGGADVGVDIGVDGAILAAPMHDTVKRASAAGDGADLLIETTLDRNTLWCAQTPQLFRYQALTDALTAAMQRGDTITDEASAMEAVGARVAIVSNTARNLKITTADDLALAQYYLTSEAT